MICQLHKLQEELVRELQMSAKVSVLSAVVAFQLWFPKETTASGKNPIVGRLAEYARRGGRLQRGQKLSQTIPRPVRVCLGTCAVIIARHRKWFSLFGCKGRGGEGSVYSRTCVIVLKDSRSC